MGSQGSYWDVGEKVNIGQTDIEITAEGANSFTENNVIGIHIPPTIQFFSGKDCTLNFDLDIAYTPTGDATPTKICLDGLIGANSLFTNVRCYAGNRQELLEELNEYSSWVNVAYSYNANDSIRNKRALSEGCGEWIPDTRGSNGTRKSQQNNYIYSPYIEQPNKGVLPTTAIVAKSPYTTAKVTLQIHTGMFANSTKAFPNILTNGAYIELTCAPNRTVFRQFDGPSGYRLLGLCPQFGSVDGANGEWPRNGQPGSNKTDFYTEIYNGQMNPQTSPFQVGEEIGLYNTITNKNYDMDPAIKITEISTGTATQPIKYTFLQSNPIAAANIPAAHDGAVVVYSKAVQTGFAPTYTISNVRLNVRQLTMEPQYVSGMMSRMKEGGVVKFDLPSVNCQLQSTLRSDVQGTLPVVCEHAKARSVIAMPTDSFPYTLINGIASGNTYIYSEEDGGGGVAGRHAASDVSRSDRSAITGIGDYLTSYNFMIDGKQVPSRRIDTDLSSAKAGGLDAPHLIELEKALQQSWGASPLSFSEFRRNFLIGRALTLDANTIYNGIGKDMRLNIRYEDSDNPPVKDKLWKIFISHIKTLNIKGDSIMVEH
tara:strand:+ start:39 stop:1829 length:1791 start_codon:yes stop_codon:yes gene_type:complete